MKYLKTIIFEMIILISLTLITTILYYFNILSNGINNTFKIIIFITTFLLSGIYISKHSNKKFYLEGIKIAFINIGLFVILNFIFKNGFNLKQIIYYLILIIITTLGSIIGGANKKNKK